MAEFLSSPQGSRLKKIAVLLVTCQNKILSDYYTK